jgi:hypothetical protein
LGFGPEKIIAEATMLAYVASGATELTSIVERLDALAQQLIPLIRSAQALADLALHPDRVFKRAVPHVLLNVLGHHDVEFDRFALDTCRRALAHAMDEPPTVVAERRWIMSLWGHPIQSPNVEEERTVLGAPYDLLVDSREAAYGFTHLLFYVTDFGKRHRREFGRPVDEILRDADALIVRCLDDEDYDLTAELLMAWPELGEPWSATAAFGFRVLAHAEDEAGVLPCSNLDAARLQALQGDERRRYARAVSYHTEFVWGFLCAAALRDRMAPPLIIGGPVLAESASASTPTTANHRQWRDVLARCTPNELRGLAPTLSEFAIMRALRSRDFREADATRTEAQRLGPPRGAWQVTADRLLTVLEAGTRVRDGLQSR